MSLFRAWRNEDGASAIEFALTAPVFFTLLVGIIELGLLCWTQLGLQHGVEMAARCASVDIYQCASIGQIQSFASDQSYGLDLPTSTFTVASASCGMQVSARYEFGFLTRYLGVGSYTLTAGSCFPK